MSQGKAANQLGRFIETFIPSVNCFHYYFFYWLWLLSLGRRWWLAVGSGYNLERSTKVKGFFLKLKTSICR